MGEDFLEAGEEIEIDPADHYIVNPRSTVVLVARGVAEFHRGCESLCARLR